MIGNTRSAPEQAGVPNCFIGREDFVLKTKSDTQLRCKRNSYGCSGSEEVAQRTARQSQVLEAANRTRSAAVGIETKVSNVAGGNLIRGNRQCADICHKVVARVLPVEQVKELGKGFDGDVLIRPEVPADAQVNLGKWHAAKFIKGCLAPVYYGTVIGDTVSIDVNSTGQRERPGALEF